MEGSMVDEKNEVLDQNNNKLDEIMLPGFRFHPTDEELVGFYLKRKIQQQPLSIELIKQLDIYKFDPWDLPKFASNTGEKEWYFYCPRDRKYRNSARPNRVTGAGFWKATGTDRPIYSSEGNKCIGLKKSLVFYKGRAAKGVKTDWMMHEFRLPSLNDSIPSSRCVDRNLPAHDSWAICRIFKKTIPITPRTLSHSWVSPSLPSTPLSNHTFHINPSPTTTNSPFTPESVTKTVSTSQSSNTNNEFDNILHSPNTTFSSFLDIPTFKSPIYPPTTTTLLDLPPSYILPQLEEPSSESSKSSHNDIPSMLLNMSSTVLDTTFNNHNKYCDRNTEFCNVGHHQVQCHDFPLGYRDFTNDGEMNYQNYQSALMENLSNLVHGDHINDYHPYFDGVEAIGSIPIAGLLSSSQSLLWDSAPLS